MNQSLALGGLTYGVTPYELTAAYAAIANGGTYVTPKLYTRVTDSDGNVILDNTNPPTRQVIKETTAFLLTSAMQDVVTSGTGGKVNFGGMAIAGKTGTTTGPTDAWFAGYTPYYTAATWTGYDNNVDLNNAEDGVSKTLWRKVMKRVHEDSAEHPVPGSFRNRTGCGYVLSPENCRSPVCVMDLFIPNTLQKVPNLPRAVTCIIRARSVLTTDFPQVLTARSSTPVWLPCLW